MKVPSTAGLTLLISDKLDVERDALADTQLLVYLATDAAIKTYPFKVENVPLP